MIENYPYNSRMGEEFCKTSDLKIVQHPMKNIECTVEWVITHSNVQLNES